MSFAAEVTLYIVVSILLVAAYLFYLLYAPIQRMKRRHNVVYAYYPKIRSVVNDFDFFLVNAFAGQDETGIMFHIDHVIVGEKFVYVIRDRYYDGSLLTSAQDPSWAYFYKNKSKLVANPMINNLIRADKLRLIAPIDPKAIIPVVVINDDAFYTPFPQSDETGYLVSLGHLGDFIAMKEESSAPKLDEIACSYFANQLHKINIPE